MRMMATGATTASSAQSPSDVSDWLDHGDGGDRRRPRRAVPNEPVVPASGDEEPARRPRVTGVMCPTGKRGRHFVDCGPARAHASRTRMCGARVTNTAAGR